MRLRKAGVRGIGAAVLVRLVPLNRFVDRVRTPGPMCENQDAGTALSQHRIVKQLDTKYGR